MPLIACLIMPFTFSQSIYYIDEENKKRGYVAHLSNLAQQIVNLAELHPEASILVECGMERYKDRIMDELINTYKIDKSRILDEVKDED